MKAQYTPTTAELDQAVCWAHEGRTHVTIDSIRATLVRSIRKPVNGMAIKQFCEDVLDPHPTITNGYTFK